MTPNIETQIWMALRTRVQSLVLTPPMSVAWPNEDFEAPDAGYIRVTQIPNLSARLFINSPVQERPGLLQLMVLTPLNRKLAVAREIAGNVADHFPQDLIMSYASVRLRVQKAPDVAQSIPTQRFLETSVMVRYVVYK